MDGKHIGIAAILAVLALAAVALIPWGISFGMKQLPEFSSPEVVLPVEIISGVIGVILVLTIVAVAFAALKLNDPTQALSLPQGSIRAVIALCLILIFAIMAIFLYGTFAQRMYTSEYEGIPLEVLQTIPKDQVIAVKSIEDKDGKTVYNVTKSNHQPPLTQDAIKFAQQILTTVSTLVVAVAGFYFGAKTSSVQPSPTSAVTLRIVSPSEPFVSLPKEKGASLSIRTESTPAGLAVEGKIEGDREGTLKQVRHDQFEYKRGGSPSDMVILRFFIASRPEVSAELKVAGEGKQPPEEKQV